MQYFDDTATGKIYAFDADVIASQVNGVYEFTSASGIPIAAPATLQPTTAPAPVVQTLAEYKAAANTEIDLAAQMVDQKYLTCGGQQGQVYSEKLAQAKAYKTAAYPALADPLLASDPDYALYGYVRAERNAMQVTAATTTDTQAADSIIAQADQFFAIGIQREEARRIGKERVLAAIDSAGIDTEKSAAIAALQAL